MAGQGFNYSQDHMVVARQDLLISHAWLCFYTRPVYHGDIEFSIHYGTVHLKLDLVSPNVIFYPTSFATTFALKVMLLQSWTKLLQKKNWHLMVKSFPTPPLQCWNVKLCSSSPNTTQPRYWTHGHHSGLNECVMLRNTNRYTNRLQLKTTIHWSASCTPTKLPVYWLRQHFRHENNI